MEMNEITKNGNGFVGYEYRDVTVKRGSTTLYADSYPNFGWTLESTHTAIGGVGAVTMKYKRDRKIRNKAELTRLQRQFEAQVAEIEALEFSKGLGASTAAYVIGVIGTALMAGSLFAYLANMLPLCIILAIPAFVGWIIPYFCYVNIRKKKIEKVAPLIGRQYDTIYEVCEKANALLAG